MSTLPLTSSIVSASSSSSGLTPPPVKSVPINESRSAMGIVANSMITSSSGSSARGAGALSPAKVSSPTGTLPSPGEDSLSLLARTLPGSARPGSRISAPTPTSASLSSSSSSSSSSTPVRSSPPAPRHTIADYKRAMESFQKRSNDTYRSLMDLLAEYEPRIYQELTALSHDVSIDDLRDAVKEMELVTSIPPIDAGAKARLTKVKSYIRTLVELDKEIATYQKRIAELSGTPESFTESATGAASSPTPKRITAPAPTPSSSSSSSSSSSDPVGATTDPHHKIATYTRLKENCQKALNQPNLELRESLIEDESGLRTKLKTGSLTETITYLQANVSTMTNLLSSPMPADFARFLTKKLAIYEKHIATFDHFKRQIADFEKQIADLT